jgi:CRISPR type III-A-associated RAMP protein Csm5
MRVKVLSVNSKGGLSWKQKHHSPKDMELYVEAIPTGQLWQHEIVWQTHLLQKEARLLGFDALEEVMIFLPEYCRRTSFNLLEQEYQFYIRHHNMELAKWFEKKINLLAKSSEEVFVLPIGWGSGYDAKTITDLLGEATFKIVVEKYKNTEGLGKPGRSKNANWLGPVDSPKSRKVVVQADGRLEPLGWVAMRFTSVDGKESDWLSCERIRLASQRPDVENDNAA